MTYSDSLHRIKRNTNPTFWNAEDIEHYNNIVNAIEKQIPKKPQAIEADDIKLCFCPCCKVRFMRYGAKHCGECGQALDWSDTE
jgi:hypothetical protein